MAPEIVFNGDPGALPPLLEVHNLAAGPRKCPNQLFSLFRNGGGRHVRIAMYSIKQHQLQLQRIPLHKPPPQPTPPQLFTPVPVPVPLRWRLVVLCVGGAEEWDRASALQLRERERHGGSWRCALCGLFDF